MAVILPKTGTYSCSGVVSVPGAGTVEVDFSALGLNAVPLMYRIIPVDVVAHVSVAPTAAKMTVANDLPGVGNVFVWVYAPPAEMK